MAFFSRRKLLLFFICISFDLGKVLNPFYWYKSDIFSMTAKVSSTSIQNRTLSYEKYMKSLGPNWYYHDKNFLYYRSASILRVCYLNNFEHYRFWVYQAFPYTYDDNFARSQFTTVNRSGHNYQRPFPSFLIVQYYKTFSPANLEKLVQIMYLLGCRYPISIRSWVTGDN